MKISRRHFITTATLSTGFTIAAQPVLSQAITTPSRGLRVDTVSIPTANGKIPAYWATPLGTGNFPIILVVQEIFGVHAHIQDVCRRLANLGYMAIAPEMFYRQGDVAQLTEIAEIRKVVAQVPDAQVMADLDATVAWAITNGGDKQRIGITGFCWGGRIVWLYAVHNPQIKAGVAWYGRLIGDRNDLTPKQPIDVARSLTVPVLGLYGGADQGIPNDTVAQMQKLLPAPSQIILYPDMPHAFFADYRASYRQQTAEDGWQKLQGWFKQYL